MGLVSFYGPLKIKPLHYKRHIQKKQKIMQ